ncbi:hypothetical protein D9619_012863 [Psilocybe cf. subviscida]|uniref:C2H2-type domain-containing protein n=1 Tax=Psilocybe cf. subviscida TaxID=2480587 RepID=A0A8H5BJK3_9AGAR|nr:hypothetical protein D9619_012863 [Psilocybe cf. subviscida]
MFNNSQTFSDPENPPSTLVENHRLLHGEDYHAIQDPFAAGSVEANEILYVFCLSDRKSSPQKIVLFSFLMSQSQEDYEASRRANLGIGLSQFDIDPYATGSFPGAFGDNLEREQFERSLPLDYASHDFETTLAQQGTGWDHFDFNPAQNCTHPEAALSAPGYEGGYQGGGELKDFIRDHETAFNGDHSNEVFLTQYHEGILLSDTPSVLAASANVPASEDDVYRGLTSTQSVDNGGAGGSNDTQRVQDSEAPPHMGGAAVNPALLMGTNFDFDFGFGFYHPSDIGLEISDLCADPDAFAAEVQGNNVGDVVDDKVDENSSEDSGSTLNSEDKENDASDATPSTNVSHDRVEPAMPLEPSSVANVANTSKGKQPENREVDAKDNAACSGTSDDKVGSSTETATSADPSEYVSADPSEQATSAKRKSTTNQAPTTQDPANAPSTSNSNSAKPPRKKVRITKDEAIAGRGAGVLTCEICIASTSKPSVYTFNRRADLNEHIRRVHEKARELECPNAKCVGKKFSTPYTLARHRKNTGH